MPRNRNIRIGRIIGAAGAACGSLFWGAVFLAVASVLMEPSASTGLAVIILMPMAIFASLLLVISVADVVVLVRGIDSHMPALVAFSHALMAFAILQFTGYKPTSFIPAAILVAISISQLVAIFLFRQITPSHASSQR